MDRVSAHGIVLDEALEDDFGLIDWRLFFPFKQRGMPFRDGNFGQEVDLRLEIHGRLS